MQNYKGGYYVYPYVDKIFLSEESLMINDQIKFIDLTYKINIEMFYGFIQSSESKSYDDVIKFLARYYNPYYNIEKIFERYTLIDTFGNVINTSSKNIMDKEILMIDNDLKFRLNNDLKSVNYEYMNNFPYEKLLNQLRPDSDPNILNLFDAALLRSNKLIEFIRDFQPMCPEIESMIGVLYNKFNEPTKFNNPFKIMYDIGSFDIILKILRNGLINNFRYPTDEIFLKNYKNGLERIYDNNSLDKFENLFSNDYYKNIIADLHYLLKDNFIKIVNAMSYDAINTIFKRLSEVNLLGVIKNIITNIISENIQLKNNYDGFIKVINNIKLGANVENIIIKFNLINLPDSNKKNLLIIIKNLLKKIQITYKNDNEKIILFNKYIILILKLSACEIYYNGLSLNKNEIIDIFSELLKSDEKLKKFIDSIQINPMITIINTHRNVINFFNEKLNVIKNGDNYIENIISKFNELICKFNIRDSKLYFCEDIVKLIVDEIINIGGEFIDNQLNVRTIITNIPSFKNISTKEFRIKDLLLNDILIKINDEIDDIKTPAMKYYFKFICELSIILYYINKINICFNNNCNYKLNIGNIIAHIYMLDLFNNPALFVSRSTIVKNIYMQNNINDQNNLNKNIVGYKDQLMEFIVPNYRSVGYNSTSGVSDCLESTIRDFINVMILSGPSVIDINLLPQETNTAILNFYSKYNKLEQHYSDNLRKEWVEIFNTEIKTKLEKKYAGQATTFFHDDRPFKFQDMKSNFINFTNAIMIIFGNKNTTSLELDNAENECAEIIKNIVTMFKKECYIEFLDSNMIFTIDDKLIFKIVLGHSYLEDIKNYDFILLDDFKNDFNGSIFNQLMTNNYNNIVELQSCDIIGILYNYKYNNQNILVKKLFKSIKLIKYFINNNLFDLYLKYLFLYSNKKVILSVLLKIIDDLDVNKRAEYIESIKKNIIKYDTVIDYYLFKLDMYIDKELLLISNIMNTEGNNKIMEIIIMNNIDQIEKLINFFIVNLIDSIDLLVDGINRYIKKHTLNIIKLFSISQWLSYHTNNYLENVIANNYTQLYDDILETLSKIKNNGITYLCDNPIDLIISIRNHKFNNKVTNDFFKICDSYSRQNIDDIYNVNNENIKQISVNFFNDMVPYDFYLLLCHFNNNFDDISACIDQIYPHLKKINTFTYKKLYLDNLSLEIKKYKYNIYNEEEDEEEYDDEEEDEEEEDNNEEKEGGVIKYLIANNQQGGYYKKYIKYKNKYLRLK